MSYDAKINLAINLVKQFYSDHHSKTYKIFSKVKRHIKYRHRIAHCNFEWHDPTLLSFTVWDLVKTKGKNKESQHHRQFIYTVDVSNKILLEFLSAAKDLQILCETISDDISIKLPNFFSCID